MSDGRMFALIGLARSNRWALPILGLTGMVCALAEGVSIGLFIPLFDTLLGDASRPSGPFAAFAQSLIPFADPMMRFVVIGLGIMALMALKAAFLIAHVRLSAQLAGRISRDIRMAACRQLLEVGYSFFQGSNQGRLLAVLDMHAQRTSEAMLVLTMALIQASSAAIGLVLLLSLSWSMTVIVVVLLIPALLLVQRVSRAAHRAGGELVGAFSRMTEVNLELLNAMRTIRVFNQESEQERRTAAAADRFITAFRRSETLIQSIPAIAEFLYLPAFLAVFAYAMWTQVALPSLLVFMLLLYRIQPSLKRLDQARVMLDNYLPSVSEVLQLLRRDDKPYILSGPHTIGRFSDRIEFDRVTLRFDLDHPPALTEVSFVIERGETVALIGPSGSGKSTLINLLFRLYDPDSGAIRVDGRPLTELDLSSWRSHLAFAGQDAELIAGTLRENLAFGDPSCTDEQIRTALDIVSATEFVGRLPQGYLTDLGPRGTRLSGGQRQRIALARAILHCPSILVLDEATNAVDSVTEQEIKRAISRMLPRPTIILVTHRRETLWIANKAVAIDSGRVVAMGTPREVMDRVEVELAMAVAADPASEAAH